MKKERTTPVEILAAALLKAGLRSTQGAYLQVLLMLWLVIPGRHNFTNLSRYHTITERTHRNWFKKPLPWVPLTSTLVIQAQEDKSLSKTGIIGVDAVFITKYGAATPDVAHFWSGCQSRAIHGLEGSGVTWIDPVHKQAVPLSITQTPAEVLADHSRVDFYATSTLNTLAQMPDELRNQVEAVVGDAYYTKRSFVDRVVDEGGFPFVGKARKDFNLKRLYRGPRTGKPGRPKQYDGKVSLTDFSRWDVIPWADVCTVYTTTAYSVGLRRVVRVVCLLWPFKKGHRLEVLYSTDVGMDAAKVIELYRARFAMEFPFRDGKQFAGLESCQSRQVEALHFHWNMALLAVTTARLSQLRNQREAPLVFSMEDEKRRAHNEFFAQRILTILSQDPSEQKFDDLLSDLLNLGVKAA